MAFRGGCLEALGGSHRFREGVQGSGRRLQGVGGEVLDFIRFGTGDFGTEYPFHIPFIMVHSLVSPVEGLDDLSILPGNSGCFHNQALHEGLEVCIRMRAGLNEEIIPDTIHQPGRLTLSFSLSWLASRTNIPLPWVAIIIILSRGWI